eukprot:5125314-Alexandrium_andersonii.AAC.1
MAPTAMFFVIVSWGVMEVQREWGSRVQCGAFLAGLVNIFFWDEEITVPRATRGPSFNLSNCQRAP